MTSCQDSKNQELTFLTDEEMQRVQILDANDETLVVYKPRRSKGGKMRASKVESNHELHGSDDHLKGKKSKKKRKSTRGPSFDNGDTNRLSNGLDPEASMPLKKHKPKNRDSRDARKEKPNRRSSRDSAESAMRTIPHDNRVEDIEQCSQPSARQGIIERRLRGAETGNIDQATDHSVNYFPSNSDTLATKRQRSPPVQHSANNHGSETPIRGFTDKARYRLRSAFKELMRFRALKLSQLLLAFYILFLTFADIGPPGGLRDTETGLIVDQASAEKTEKGLILVNGTERAIVGATKFQVACIGIARASAWIMYPGKCIASQHRKIIPVLHVTY